MWTRTRVVLSGGAALCALASFGAPVAVAATDRQTASFTFTATQPGVPTGSSFSVDWQDPANPGGKPYAVMRTVVTLPPGAVTDTSVLEQCKATNAELEAQGAAACPPSTRVGGGEIVSDTGSTGAFPPRFVHTKADLFNNANELIGVADATDSPVVPGVTRTVNRSPIQGTTTTADYPAFPGSPPPDNYSAIKTLRLSGPPIVHNGRPYLRTPPTCPSAGQWTTTITFIYFDGVSQTVTANSPCHRGRHSGSSATPQSGGTNRPPKIRLRGLPSGCARRAFALGVKITGQAGPSTAALFLDGRLISQRASRSFTKHVPVARLSSGRHRLMLVARDASGNRAAKTAHFRRCAR
jgi:hypothetical protein